MQEKTDALAQSLQRSFSNRSMNRCRRSTTFEFNRSSRFEFASISSTYAVVIKWTVNFIPLRVMAAIGARPQLLRYSPSILNMPSEWIDLIRSSYPFSPAVFRIYSLKSIQPLPIFTHSTIRSLLPADIFNFLHTSNPLSSSRPEFLFFGNMRFVRCIVSSLPSYTLKLSSA